MSEPVLRITIDVMPDGGVAVNGPLMNKIAVLGALAMAQQIVASYAPEDAPMVVPASVLPGSFQ